MRIILAAALGAVMAMPAVAQTQSAPGWQQTLQGLMTGNQNQDSALRQAYERGYQRGRDDEARALQANNRSGSYDRHDFPAGPPGNAGYGNGGSGNNYPGGYGQQGSYNGGYNNGR